MDYQKLAASIIQNVGGVDNVILLTHCMTRLRFNLKDSNLVNKTALEDLKGVVGVIYAGGQYMIILGKNLLPVYESITKNFAVKTGAAVSENLDNTAKEPLTWKNVGNKIVGFVSAAVTPIVPGLVAGGMLKVVILLIVTFIDPAFNKTTSYQLISAIADAPFYFMPVLVAYGAANKLGATPVYAMVATAALLHHNFIDLVVSGKPITLMGIIVRPLNYGTSLLPALLIAIVAYYSEKFLNKIVPGIFKSIFVGMGTIFIAGSLGYLILGPLGNMLGQIIANIFMFLNTYVGPLAVGLLAAALPWLVMTGMHTALSPFMLQLLDKPGYDPILRSAFLMHNMAEGGANIGVALRTKDKEFKSECWSLAVGCIVAGVTEPAIYGVNLKLKKPMYGVMAGGFAGGMVASLLGAKAYIMGYSNILALPIFGKTVGAIVVAIIIAIVVAAAVTYFVYQEGTQPAGSKPKSTIKASDQDIVAIADAQLSPITTTKDSVFADKTLGDGVAFELHSDLVCAPANGLLASLYPTGHAFGLITASEVEILVHIGIDTVKAQGEGFELLAKQDQEVKAGQPIVKVDRQKLKQAGYDLTTVLVIMDDKDQQIKLLDHGDVKMGTKLNL